MCSIQLIRYQLLRRHGIAVLTATLLCAGIGRADRFPPDPVEELRLALTIKPSALPQAPIPSRNLIPRIEALRSLGDMRRALALQDWSSQAASAEELAFAERKRQALLLLVDRFKKGIRQVLKHGSIDARLAVMVMLSEMGPGVRGPDPEDQNGIARTLAPDLAALIKSESAPIIKEIAARTLGQIFANPDVAVPALRDLYASGTVQERRAAVSGLAGLMRTAGQLASKLGITTEVPVERGETMRDIIQAARDVVPLASRGLNDSDLGVRRLSAEAMRQAATAFYTQVPRPSSSEETSDFPSLKPDVRTLLSVMEMFEKQTPVLGKALNDPDADVRSLTERALEQLAGARQRLKHATDSNSAPAVPARPSGSQGARLDLGWLMPVAVQSQAAASPDPLLEMVRTLLPILEARVRDPNVQVRLEAIDALETLDRAAVPAVPALVQALADPNRFVRWAAARTLGKMGPVEPAHVVPPLARLLFDPDLNVRLAAALALDRFGPAAEPAVPALSQATKASDALEREAAIRTLGGIGTGAQPALPALTAALSDPDPRVRQAAAEVVAKFGSLAAGAESALRKALDDPDDDVRKAASDALLSILQADK